MIRALMNPGAPVNLAKANSSKLFRVRLLVPLAPLEIKAIKKRKVDQ